MDFPSQMHLKRDINFSSRPICRVHMFVIQAGRLYPPQSDSQRPTTTQRETPTVPLTLLPKTTLNLGCCSKGKFEKIVADLSVY